jgi:ABC-type microcin C transport system duplicated ATPase subunit YejF
MTSDAPVTNEASAPLLSVKDLVVHFKKHTRKFLKSRESTVHAVCGTSFDIQPGETLGLVGESGCGKTTTGRAVLQLIRPTSGSVTFAGNELTGLKREELREVRQTMQVVFQDPFGSLDPRMPVGEAIAEPLKIHGQWTKSEGRDRVGDMMNLVGLERRFANRFPNEFSGNASGWVSLAPSFSIPDSSCSTSRSRLWMSQSRPVSSICSKTCGLDSAWPTCSLLMTCR